MADKTYAELVLAEIGRHDHAIGTLSDPTTAVIQHVTKREEDGTTVRLDTCPCSRGEDTLPTDQIGRPVLELLGEGQYVSSGRHTLADLVHDITSA